MKSFTSFLEKQKIQNLLCEDDKTLSEVKKIVQEFSAQQQQKNEAWKTVFNFEKTANHSSKDGTCEICRMDRIDDQNKAQFLKMHDILQDAMTSIDGKKKFYIPDYEICVKKDNGDPRFFLSFICCYEKAFNTRYDEDGYSLGSYESKKTSKYPVMMFTPLSILDSDFISSLYEICKKNIYYTYSLGILPVFDEKSYMRTRSSEKDMHMKAGQIFIEVYAKYFSQKFVEIRYTSVFDFLHAISKCVNKIEENLKRGIAKRNKLKANQIKHDLKVSQHRAKLKFKVEFKNFDMQNIKSKLEDANSKEKFYDFMSHSIGFSDFEDLCSDVQSQIEDGSEDIDEYVDDEYGIRHKFRFSEEDASSFVEDGLQKKFNDYLMNRCRSDANDFSNDVLDIVEHFISSTLDAIKDGDSICGEWD